MSDNHFSQPASRLAVILYGNHNRNRKYERSLKKHALAEALTVLGRAGTACEISSHPFHFDGDHFLLSTLTQPARETTRRIDGHRVESTRLAPRLVIEVAPAPASLTKRTLLRSRGPGVEASR
jgi:hypothetical protein